MKVKVMLHGPYREGRFREAVRELPAGATARTVVEALGLPLPLALGGIVLIGGVHAGLDDPLADGDELTLLPPMEGG